MNKDEENNPVVVYAGNSFNANMVKNILENEGIDAHITNEIVGTFLPWHTAPGGFEAIRVAVMSDYYEKARAIVEEYEKNVNE